MMGMRKADCGCFSEYECRDASPDKCKIKIAEREAENNPPPAGAADVEAAKPDLWKLVGPILDRQGKGLTLTEAINRSLDVAYDAGVAAASRAHLALIAERDQKDYKIAEMRKDWGSVLQTYDDLRERAEAADVARDALRVALKKMRKEVAAERRSPTLNALEFNALVLEHIDKALAAAPAQPDDVVAPRVKRKRKAKTAFQRTGDWR